MSQPTIIGPAYMHVQEGTVARTVECGSGVLVDVDEGDRILGVESLDNPDFFLAMFVAMRRLRVSGGSEAEVRSATAPSAPSRPDSGTS